MDKTALNPHLVTTRLKRCFYHLKSAVDQMCGKVLVRLPMKGMISFILLLVGHVFRGDKFLVVFIQVWDWHRKSARGTGWDGLRGSCGFRSYVKLIHPSHDHLSFISINDITVFNPPARLFQIKFWRSDLLLASCNKRLHPDYIVKPGM